MTAENPIPVASIAAKVKNSLTAKIFVLGFIVLILLIPYFMAVGLRETREGYAFQAEQEVSSKWGAPQELTAPVLRIPVWKTVQTKDGETQEKAGFFILPERLEITGDVTPEIRNRGIYQILLYRTNLKINADFAAMPAEIPEGWQVMPSSVPELLLRVSDVKGIVSLTTAVNGKTIAPQPGSIVSIPLKELSGENNGKLTFASELTLNGCSSFLVTAIGKQFSLKLKSPWAHPSFTGNFLPDTREVSEKGFAAEWNVGELNSGFRPNWVGTWEHCLPVNDTMVIPSGTTIYRGRRAVSMGSNGINTGISSVGVSLVQPASTYVQVERVSDYAFLVISIVLAAFLIGECVTKIWIHPLQYFFAGLSLVMFYVLLLALAEHIPFAWSYFVSTVVIAGMTTLYCRMIFARKRPAALLLGGIMLLAYALIYVLTRLEDYALLAGSMILLVLLGVLMRVTGNMNKSENRQL